MKVLIIRFSSAGDILLTVPVISAVKKNFKNSKVHILVKEKFAAPARLAGADRVITLKKGVIGELNAEKYDIILDLQNNLKSRFISLSVGAAKKRTYKKDVIKRRLMVAFKWFMGGRKRVADKYMETLEGIVPSPKSQVSRPKATPQSGLSAGASAKAGIRNRTVVLHVGAKWPLKQWPYFAELAELLRKEKGVRVVLTGIKDEVEKTAEILYIKGPGIRNEIGKTDFPGLARIISGAGLFAGNDTAAAHLAGLYGVPAVVFLGPTVQEFGFITGSNFRVIERNMACRPCHLHGGKKCPIGTHGCLKGISAEHAAAEIKKIFN